MSRFSEEQIIGILREQQAGEPELCRRHGAALLRRLMRQRTPLAAKVWR